MQDRKGIQGKTKKIITFSWGSQARSLKGEEDAVNQNGTETPARVLKSISKQRGPREARQPK